MSIHYLAHVWRYATDLKQSKLLVLLALADCANDDGICWPSIAYIADKSRTTRRSAQRSIQDLRLAGYVEIEEGQGPSGVNLYRVRLDQQMGIEDAEPGGRQIGAGDKQPPPTPTSPGTITSQDISKGDHQKELDGSDVGKRFVSVFGVPLDAVRYRRWQKRWPGRAFVDDLDEAMDWVESNPRKGPSDRKRPWMFLTNWLRRAVDYQAEKRAKAQPASVAAHESNIDDDTARIGAERREGRTRAARDVVQNVRRDLERRRRETA